MADIIKLSPEEIGLLKLEFLKFEELIKTNDSAFLQFKSEPVTYFRMYGREIIKYINNDIDPFTTRKFSMTIRNMLRYRDVLDPCAGCAVSVLAIIYATCWSARIAVDGFWGVIAGIIEVIKAFFNLANELVRNLLDYLKELEGMLNPYQLALRICRYLNICN